MNNLLNFGVFMENTVPCRAVLRLPRSLEVHSRIHCVIIRNAQYSNRLDAQFGPDYCSPSSAESVKNAELVP